MQKTQCIFTFMLLLSNNYFSFAQQKEIELDPVTVTSSLLPTQTSKTGRNIIVIKGEQFLNLPINSIDELLRYVPGMEVQARGPMGAQSDFILRGGTFQQVLVLVDGVRVNDPNTGHFSSYIPIAPAEIERIEILKGGSSAIYGSDAVGGVIHIITKSFNAHSGQKRKHFKSQITIGENNLANINAGGFYSNGKTVIGGGILSNNARGEKQRGINGYYHLNTFSFSLQQHINNDWHIALRSAYDDRDFAAQNFYTAIKLDTASEKVKTFWNQLHIVYQKNKNKISLDAGYKTVNDEFLLNPSGIANNNKSKLWQALAVYERRFTTQTILTSGGQFQLRKIRSNDRGNHDIKQLAGFASLKQMFGESFTINPALRIDWNELGGTELVPQLNLSYRISSFQLRGSIGKTIRHADFTEQYNNYNKPPFVRSGNRIGNPDLSAERSLSYEAGVDVFMHDNLKISSTFFQRDYDDLIDYVLTPYNQIPRRSNLAVGGNFFFAKNIAEVKTTGFETDLQFRKKINDHQHINTNFGVVWLDSESKEAIPSLYISSHADFLANFSVQYSIRSFSLGVNGLYKKRNPIFQNETASSIFASLSEDYFVANAKAEILVYKKLIGLFAQVDNLFDKNYSDLLGAKMPGRWIMGGIKISLTK
ncbi:MAG: TonB-dependent receptor plug domain-containing protein [Chitinophagaceae bacterium]